MTVPDTVKIRKDTLHAVIMDDRALGHGGERVVCVCNSRRLADERALLATQAYEQLLASLKEPEDLYDLETGVNQYDPDWYPRTNVTKYRVRPLPYFYEEF